ncbi:MAG TPA: YciI family protein [Gammaproteobacteria bacterium]|nr:YciI family protein [Gammaproteobacteria bacterium]
MNRYLVLTQRTPGFQPYVLKEHYEFLGRLRSAALLELAGPFSDRSGGAYLIRAANLEEATAMAHQDPLHQRGFSRLSVHEWDAA